MEDERPIREARDGDEPAPEPPRKVIPLMGVTRFDVPPAQVLEHAIAADLEGVIVIGFRKTGEEFACSSYADGGVALWLMERTKMRLMGNG